MILEEYIQSLLNYKGFENDIVCHRSLSPVNAAFADADALDGKVLPAVLRCLGIERLYKHQHKAIQQIRQGRHTVIATPTASGKSLIYNLPVLEELVENPQAHALYLFPLKALARDQLDTVNGLLKALNLEFNPEKTLSAAVYDGDISSYQKTKIRNNLPHILLTNPEMLHLSMLAHHDLWKAFFSDLQFVVVDEVHTYRGVMGSNMAWVFRRLLRICNMYGADPVFVFCSATIANPVELTRLLTGLDVELIDKSTAPSGQKDVILMKGVDGAAKTAIALIHAAVHRELRTIVYTQSRKITELIAVWSSDRAPSLSDKISAYRAGFLPEERREIERQLASGDLLAVVSTSALELGIDIGNLDICILVGYPGTIMSTWQRAGRVGREGNNSVLILIAHEDALDQYFINHPDQFFNMPPEHAIINPDNEIILKNHVECTAAEFVISCTEPMARDKAVAAAIVDLESEGRLLKSENGKLWYAARKSPHRHVNLRGTSRSIPIFLQDTQQVLGEMDRHRAFFEAHEGAVYLHRGESYIITAFDHEQGVIEARPKSVNYFTRARSNKSTHILEVLESKTVFNTRVSLGRLKILEQVTGYQKKQVGTQKSLGIVPLDLPVIEFETLGLWIDIPDRVREEIETERFHFMGGIHALEHAVIGILPLLVMTDRNDLGGISIPHHPQTGKAAVFVYDGVPGGLGLTRTAYRSSTSFFERTRDVIRNCSCDNGCPACVHSPKCGSGNRPIDKASSLRILDLIMHG
ncbi:MAG: DEAD/DEAH box helicase, partial [Desulfobacteraceae bacterium]